MNGIVYTLGAFTSVCCGFLLLRGYSRVKKRLLLWSGLCFVMLAISNLLIFVDLIILPEVDLYRYRLVTAAVAMILLLYGLIWESD